jgi:protein-disulfide isomerase
MKYHFQWINDSQIKYTPTLFINGFKLPSRYQIDDLDKLIPLILETDF